MTSLRAEEAMTKPGRIYQDVESKGDFYEPAIYDLLTFHNSMFETEND